MAKEFKDFIFANHKLSEYGDFICADFNGGDSEIVLGLEREMETGNTNPYRLESNYYGDKWSSPLSFELHIMKNPCTYSVQKDMEFTKNEIRQITRWLTSSHYPLWIEFEYSPDKNDEIIHYKGWFNNIETFSVGGGIYGLKLYFTCSTSFGYTDYKNYDILGISENIVNKNILNDSDELESYCYPKIKINPNSTGQIFMCNLSDCKILESALLENASLNTIAENYALKNWYEIKYTDTNNIPVYICDGNALQFYLVDKYGNDTKCTIFHWVDTGYYYLIEGGFVFMDTKSNLEINIDCQKLLIQDSIGRMITYDELGITDVDHMYWLRLLNGDNMVLVYGDANFTFNFRESRKVGE